MRARKRWFRGQAPDPAETQLALAWAAYTEIFPDMPRTAERPEDMSPEARRIWFEIGKDYIRKGAWTPGEPRR